jgi:Tetratricopeptide repeat
MAHFPGRYCRPEPALPLQDQPARVLELHQRNLTDYARVFGTDHSETITARSNLAYAYQLANDYGHAIPLHQQVLADRERLYGPDHHYTRLARQLLTAAERQASAFESAKDPDDRQIEK